MHASSWARRDASSCGSGLGFVRQKKCSCRAKGAGQRLGVSFEQRSYQVLTPSLCCLKASSCRALLLPGSVSHVKTVFLSDKLTQSEEGFIKCYQRACTLSACRFLAGTVLRSAMKQASSPFLLPNATAAQYVKNRFLQQSVRLFGAKMHTKRQYLSTRGK